MKTTITGVALLLLSLPASAQDYEFYDSTVVPYIITDLTIPEVDQICRDEYGDDARWATTKEYLETGELPQHRSWLRAEVAWSNGFASGRRDAGGWPYAGYGGGAGLPTNACPSGAQRFAGKSGRMEVINWQSCNDPLYVGCSTPRF